MQKHIAFVFEELFGTEIALILWSLLHEIGLNDVNIRSLSPHTNKLPWSFVCHWVCQDR